MASAGRDVTLWAFESDCVDAINNGHENTLYLKGVPLSPAIKATSDFADLADMDAVLAVPPAQHMRATLAGFAPHVKGGLPIVLCSKGIEHKTLKFMAGVLEDVIPQARGAGLSGPSFASDVAKGLPTAVTLACEDAALGQALCGAIATPGFRPYLSDDIIGAEIGGAVKNVLAIACGLVLGKGLGKSAHAAVIARGFREMTRLGEALGAQAETLTGLCGLGDLVLTCSSEQSRNMSCGLALGKGQTLEEIMAGRAAVTEGVATAPALKTLAAELGVDMPICCAMADILAGDISVEDVITRLLARDLKSEIG
jgi:glycerol-3-phosphate dehydrogenase (NAD(P)+)